MAQSDENAMKNLQLLLTDLPAEFRTRLKKSHSWLTTTKKKPRTRRRK